MTSNGPSEANLTQGRHIPLSQDAALVVALAGTAMPFAHSAEDVAERWLRALRLHGLVGATLQALGYTNVRAKQGDGYAGWPQHAPFSAIIVTAAPDHVPPPLVEQLAVGGRLVIPVGGRMIQQMTVITKDARGVTSEERMAVRFVPLIRAKD